jgi:ABC-type lipoprotein release transport system permease subunit
VSGSPAAPSAHRAAVFALVATALTVVLLLACWIPARRATRGNPVDALRFD